MLTGLVRLRRDAFIMLSRRIEKGSISSTTSFLGVAMIRLITPGILPGLDLVLEPE